MRYGIIWPLCAILSPILIICTEYNEYGNHNYHQIEVAFEGPIQQDKSSLYRVYGAYAYQIQNQRMHNNNYYGYCTATDFKNIFADICDEYEILKSYELYAYPAFITKRIAINAVKENLRNNAEKISLWFNNESLKEMICDFSHSHSIGRGIFKANNSPYYDLKNSKMILRKDKQCELGFKIITAFPV